MDGTSGKGGRRVNYPPPPKKKTVFPSHLFHGLTFKDILSLLQAQPQRHWTSPHCCLNWCCSSIVTNTKHMAASQAGLGAVLGTRTARTGCLCRWCQDTCKAHSSRLNERQLHPIPRSRSTCDLSRPRLFPTENHHVHKLAPFHLPVSKVRKEERCERAWTWVLGMPGMPKGRRVKNKPNQLQ